MNHALNVIFALYVTTCVDSLSHSRHAQGTSAPSLSYISNCCWFANNGVHISSTRPHICTFVHDHRPEKLRDAYVKTDTQTNITRQLPRTDELDSLLYSKLCESHVTNLFHGDMRYISQEPTYHQEIPEYVKTLNTSVIAPLACNFNDNYLTSQDIHESLREQNVWLNTDLQNKTFLDTHVPLSNFLPPVDAQLYKFLWRAEGHMKHSKQHVPKAMWKMAQLVRDHTEYKRRIYALAQPDTLNLTSYDIFHMLKKDRYVVFRADEIHKTVTFLYNYGWNTEEISTMITKHPWISKNVINLEGRLEILTKTLGLKRSEVLNIGRRYPSVMIVGDVQRKLRQVWRYSHLGKYVHEKWQGLSYNETIQLFKKWPNVVTYNIDRTLKPKLAFLFNEMQYNCTDLMKFPQYLAYNYVKRIWPRYFIMKEIGLNLPSNAERRVEADHFIRLEDMLVPSDDAFIQRFNVPKKLFIKIRMKGEKASQPQLIF